MKLFKKFLLVAGAIGLVSSFGFANKAMAADPALNATVTGDKVKFTYTSVSADKIEYSLDDELVESISITPGTQDEKTVASIKSAIAASASLNADTYSTLTARTYYTTSGNQVTEKRLSESKNLESPLYKVTVKAGSNGLVSLSPDEEDAEEEIIIYDYATSIGESYLVYAKPAADYKFSKWADGNTDNPREIQAKSTVSKNKYTAIFEEKGSTTEQYFKYQITRKNGTVESEKTVRGTNKEETLATEKMYHGDKISFTKPTGFSMAGLSSTYFEGTVANATVKDTAKAGTAVVYAYSTNDDTVTTCNLTITIVDSVKVSTSDYVEYVTNDYTMEFKASTESKSTGIEFFVKDEFKDYAEIKEITRNTSDGNVTVKIKIKDKVDKGTNEKAIKLTAKVDGADATIDNTTDKEKTLTIYSYPTASFSSTDRTLSFKAPKKVNTGTDSGVDDNSKDNTITKISDVKGIKLQVISSGGDSLGFTETAKSKGTSGTIDATTMENIVINLSGKFSGESTTASFKAFPVDSDVKYNKNVYGSTSAPVYRAVITYTDEAGATKTVTIYGFEGQTIDAAAIEKVDSTLKGKKLTLKDSSGKDITSFKMGTSASVNDHTAVLGASKSADSDGTGLDKVPKTGQNNAMVFVMVAIVAAAVCAGLYFYNKKAKNV